MKDPIKDLTKEHPIPDLWKDSITRIVKEISNGNFNLDNAGKNITLQSADLATINNSNVRDYGCTLTPLLEQTWESSRAQWMGKHWDIIIDLCTAEEGVSDLVLSGRVYPSISGFEYEVGLIFVP